MGGVFFASAVPCGVVLTEVTLGACAAVGAVVPSSGAGFAGAAPGEAAGVVVAAGNVVTAVFWTSDAGLAGTAAAGAVTGAALAG